MKIQYLGFLPLIIFFIYSWSRDIYADGADFWGFARVLGRLISVGIVIVGGIFWAIS